jgi:ABC-type phosphate transport system substrate-binding protein
MRNEAMTKNTRPERGIRPGAVAILAAGLVLTGCGKKGGDSGAQATSIQNIGSDTMVNLAQAWAEAYHKVDPSVSVEVSGGGSGIGVAALINGTCDVANCSRALEPEEVEKATFTPAISSPRFPSRNSAKSTKKAARLINGRRWA